VGDVVVPIRISQERTTMTKTITLEPITRIEGHARVTLDVDEKNTVIDGRLHVLEVRGFEKLLEGMELLKMPIVTGRICGVCPAAHHLAAAIAIEQGARTVVPEKAALLRELLYAGHILHSHALSCFVLTGPDLINGINAAPQTRNIFSLLASTPDAAKKMLRLRSIGQRIVECVGGRGVHPVTVIAGGMASEPTAEERQKIAGWGAEAGVLLHEIIPLMLEALSRIAEVREAGRMTLPAMALSNNGMVDFLKGSCVVMDGQNNAIDRFEGPDYARHVIEHVAPGSYMKSVRLRGSPEKSYYVGPLARAMVNSSFSSPNATGLLAAFKKKCATGVSAIDNIEARLIEMVHCAERINAIASMPKSDSPLAVPVSPAAGRYIGMVEAPRGILIHDYTANENGLITAANLIVATQNNYDAMNGNITRLAQYFQPKNDNNALMNGVEFALRCFDPCLACATHAMGKMPLTIEVKRNDCVITTITREANNDHCHTC
jgi:F420-non-reducing hydrogenase large subunit